MGHKHYVVHTGLGEGCGVQAEPGADPVGVGVDLSTDEKWCVYIRIVEEISVRP